VNKAQAKLKGHKGPLNRVAKAGAHEHGKQHSKVVLFTRVLYLGDRTMASALFTK